MNEMQFDPGARVLDIGCGAGDVTILVADLLGPRDDESMNSVSARWIS